VDKAKQCAADISKNLDRIRTEHPTCQDEINRLLGAQHRVRSFEGAAAEFSNMILVYQKLGPNAAEYGMQLGLALNAAMRNLSRFSHDFGQWIHECGAMIQGTRISLRQ
jgi:hypothetical protein